MKKLEIYAKNNLIQVKKQPLGLSKRMISKFTKDSRKGIRTRVTTDTGMIINFTRHCTVGLSNGTRIKFRTKGKKMLVFCKDFINSFTRDRVYFKFQPLLAQ